MVRRDGPGSVSRTSAGAEGSGARAGTGRRPYGRRRRAVRYARTGRYAVLGAVPAVLLCFLVSCSSPAPDSSARDTAGGKRLPYWVPGKTPAQVARSMNVTIPPRAAGLRAAWQRGFQSDTVLLAFTLPRSDTAAFLRALRPSSLAHRDAPVGSAADHAPATPFARLGLPEPDTLPDVTEGPVCTDCNGELEWLNVAVHPVGANRDQVYLSGAE
ncbi:hypothetical protein GCM10018787_53000 [Streptomyces thermodiastaticus]|nr:hypothetical protein GCM10018787_53000 [Streptomyces thermodiastaticus]